MRGLGWFLLANFDLVLLARMAGAEVPWLTAVVAVTFLFVGAALLLGSDRYAQKLADHALQIAQMEVRLRQMRSLLEQSDRERGPDMDFRGQKAGDDGP